MKIWSHELETVQHFYTWWQWAKSGNVKTMVESQFVMAKPCAELVLHWVPPFIPEIGEVQQILICGQKVISLRQTELSQEMLVSYQVADAFVVKLFNRKSVSSMHVWWTHKPFPFESTSSMSLYVLQVFSWIVSSMRLRWVHEPFYFWQSFSMHLWCPHKPFHLEIVSSLRLFKHTQTFHLGNESSMRLYRNTQAFPSFEHALVVDDK